MRAEAIEDKEVASADCIIDATWGSARCPTMRITYRLPVRGRHRSRHRNLHFVGVKLTLNNWRYAYLIGGSNRFHRQCCSEWLDSEGRLFARIGSDKDACILGPCRASREQSGHKHALTNSQVTLQPPRKSSDTLI